MAIVETRVVTGGVDIHVAAALDHIGGLLGVEAFPVSVTGYARLLAWLRRFGTIEVVGIEGTGSYGAGRSRHLAAAGVAVVEVNRSDRQDRRRSGKSDTLDAISAARSALSRRARGVSRGRDGSVEAIRVLVVAKRSARGQRIATINQARSLVFTGPDEIRARFVNHSTADLIAKLAVLRPRPGEVIGYSTRIAVRELARRVEWLDAQADRLDELIVALVSLRAPGLLGLYGVGVDCAAALLVAAGDHPERLASSPRPPGRISAGSLPSRHRRARPPAGSGSTPPATATPTMPCGASSSPA